MSQHFEMVALLAFLLHLVLLLLLLLLLAFPYGHRETRDGLEAFGMGYRYLYQNIYIRR